MTIWQASIGLSSGYKRPFSVAQVGWLQHHRLMTPLPRLAKLLFCLGVLSLFSLHAATAAIFPIATNAKLRDHGFPSVASDGSNHLVGLQFPNSTDSQAQVAVQLLSATGSPLGSPVLFATDGDATIVGFDGTNYLVVWSQGSFIHGQFLSKAGAKIGSVIQIGQMIASGSSSVATLAFDGTNYLIVWRDANQDIYAQLLSRSGNRVGTALKVNTAGGGPPAVRVRRK